MAKAPTTSFEVFLAMQQEIQAYKWKESQQAGEDIGLERALTEWVEKHGAAWRKKILGTPATDAKKD